ncbi:MAG: TonB-dependent receptor domain-containing protein [Ferruginibacter sp.]
MKKYFTFLVLLLCTSSFTVFAQSSTTIKGTVSDLSKQPVSGATISLLAAKDSSLIKLSVSDNRGNFEISSSTGDYLISIVHVGYEKKWSAVFQATTSSTVLEPIILNAVTTKLKDVTVTAKKPLIEVRADKTIFNVEASINATGSNALELLQKSPGMQVDNNDNISMKGKTGVRVYVDGKMMQLDTKDLAAYLRSINSNDIEAIEMIANPSAKYDASGNAGIVNIRLKKNKKFGTNGSVNAGFIQGVTPKGNGSLNLNYRDKAINIFGNAGVNLGNNENTMFLKRIQKDTLYDQASTNINKNKSFNIKAGADFFIDKKRTFGVMATVNHGNNEFASEGNTPIYYVPTGQFIKNLKATNSIPNNRTNANFNINYRYADTTGKEINFDADYGFFRGDGRSFQPNYYYDNSNVLLYKVVNRNFTPTDIDIYTAKVDVEKKLGKGKFGYGAKTSVVLTKNTFDFFNDNSNGEPIKILDRSNRFKYSENVNAAYANYQAAINSKWSYQIGLRAEQTNSKGVLTRADGVIQPDDEVKKSYIDFFPSGALTWNINAKHALNLTYSRRIDRPTYQDLNPFENKLDELTYQKGNAFLQPQYTDNVELTHTFMGFINTTVGYSHVKDYATETTDSIGNATFVQQQNLATQDILNFNIGAPLPIKKWWNGYVNLWYSYQIFNGEIGDNKVKVNIPLYGAYIQNSFNLGKEYNAEISGWFNGPGIWGATWRSKSQGAVDIGIQKNILKKRGSLKISATDIFRTAPWRASNNFGGMSINGGGAWESRTFRLNFSWRFGSNQINNSRARKTGSESEANRIK